MSPAVAPERLAAPRTSAVVVTLNPERQRFEEQAQRLRLQVDQAIVVDNGSAPATLAWLRPLAAAWPGQMQLLELGSNLGIAAAQNRGIEKALADGAGRILLMDHDSLPEPDMVSKLAAALGRLRAQGNRVAAVGPRYLDPRQNNPPPFIRVQGGRLHRLPCPDSNTVQAVDYLIASGSLIPARAFSIAGLMNEGLFIDYVDIEWGLRAQQRGLRSFGICAAQMDHDLGEEPIVVLGHALPNHSATRHYYLFRNAVWLYRYSTVPLGWKLVDIRRLMLRLGFYSLFARPRLAHLRAMFGGMWDGFRGVTGPRPQG